MRRLAAVVLVAFFAVVFASPVARAGGEGGSCGEGRLVSTGDTMAYVLAHCGPPTYASTRTATYRRASTRIDEWVYDLGDGSFPRLLLFQDGVLVSVGEGAR